MTKYLLALALLLPGAAEAACPLGGSPLNLEIPAIGNSADWAPCVRRDLLKLSTSTVLNFKADFQSTTTTPTHKFVRFLSSSGFELGSINSAGTLAWAYGLSVGTVTASGNIIGGDDISVADQGIFGGTLTVKGAMGLTASSGSFTASGTSAYAVTSSTGIRIETGKLAFGSGGFVQWADGTVSTTAPSGGGGASVFSSSFDSGNVAYTASMSTYVAHGLGGLPKFCTWMLRNVSTEHGYAVGDEVEITNTDDGDGIYRTGNWFNATNVGTEIGSRPWLIESKPSGGFVTVTVANWRLVFRCFR